MPYEYINENIVSKSFDIWSFGLIMYEILTNLKAWSGFDENKIQYFVLKKTPFFDENPKYIGE
jgi:hypothetical protein